MHSYEPSGSKFKQVCADLPNTEVLIKSSAHASVGNKSLGETVTAFALSGYPKTEVILRAAAGKLEKSKKLR